MDGGTPRPRIVPAQGPQGLSHHTQLGDPMSRMCAGPGSYRAVLVCWAQPALRVVLAPVGVYALESITQKYEGAAGARREVACALGAFRGASPWGGCAVGCRRRASLRQHPGLKPEGWCILGRREGLRPVAHGVREEDCTTRQDGDGGPGQAGRWEQQPSVLSAHTGLGAMLRALSSLMTTEVVYPP